MGSDVFAFQANALVSRVRRMPVNDKRFLMLGISKVSFQRSLREVQLAPLEFDVTASEWQELVGGTLHEAYSSLRKIAKSIMKSPVAIDDGLHPECDVSWFDSAHYVRGEGRVHVIFGWSVSKYLVGFSDEFTKIDVKKISSFDSAYSARLFELLSQFKATAYRKDTLEDFRRLMGVGTKYPSFSGFRQHVLDPAIAEIEEKAGWRIAFTPQKRGTRVVGVEFTFADFDNSAGDQPLWVSPGKSDIS